jgi:hypothetical protein
MSDEERVARRMFDDYVQRECHGRPGWEQTSIVVKTAWLKMAAQAIDEIKEIARDQQATTSS